MQGATKGGSPAHKNFGDEMAKKTVIGRACKILIGMSDDSALFDEPDETETDIAAGQRAVQIEGAPATTQQPKVTNDAPLPY